MTEDARRTTYLLVDGENIDATLGGSILGARPAPEERPRWERVLEFARSVWGGDDVVATPDGPRELQDPLPARALLRGRPGAEDGAAERRVDVLAVDQQVRGAACVLGHAARVGQGALRRVRAAPEGLQQQAFESL